MLIRKQFNKYYFKELLEELIIQQKDYTLFLNNQEKQSQNFPKEQQKCCNYILMVEYTKANLKLTDMQLEKLKTAVKNKTGTTQEKQE